MYHRPALLDISLSLLDIRPEGIYVDLTFGGGGHARAILEKMEKGRLLAFDQDPDALANLPDDPRLTFVPENFRFFSNFLKYHQAWPVDGIIADLGVSSHQFDQAERGFSTRFEGPLDMRMNPRAGRPAASFLAETNIETLSGILSRFGEIHNAFRLAETLLHRQNSKPIRTTTDLREACLPLAPRGKENQYLAKVFQALRIHINEEMQVLEEMLLQLPASLRPGGRVVIITYHSLEDRPVKHFLRSGRLDGIVQKDFFGRDAGPFRLIQRKAIQVDAQEAKENPRVRSAKLRAAEKKRENSNE
jgi:16S rRNA (cytosine1402-N4)-methyltransferase